MKRLIVLMMLTLMLSVPALAVDTAPLEVADPASMREILGDVTVG